jgi:hypothetical protein
MIDTSEKKEEEEKKVSSEEQEEDATIEKIKKVKGKKASI